MADKGRDLKVSVLSDADPFDLAKPAGDLDALGDSARDAGQELSQLAREGDELRSLGQDASGAARDVSKLADSGNELRELGTDADKAGADVKGLGDDVDKAATQVDGAFDKIAAASKRSTDKVDASAREGGESLRDMGEEGSGTAREMAASFDGSADSIKDAMQEAAANVLATLGPLGAAAGVAAAVGIGMLRAKAEALREEVSELVGVMIDAGGKLDRSAVADKLREMAEDGSITELADQARRAQLPVSDYLRALAGDPEALDRTREALRKYQGDVKSLNFSDTLDATSLGADEMRVKLAETGEAYGLAQAAVEAYQDTLGNASVAVEEHGAALEGFASSSDVYQGLLDDAMAKEQEAAQNTADKTKDQSDSWEDYVGDVTVSVDDYLDELQRQVVAQEQWSTNLGTLARRGVSEGVLAELQRMGPEGAPLVAALTKASDAELRRMVALYARKGKDSTDELEAAIQAGRPGVAGQVQEIRDDMRRRLTPQINVPVGVHGPTAGDLAAVRRGITNGLSGIQVGVTAIAKTVVSRSVP
jgi:hypothetical protein